MVPCEICGRSETKTLISIQGFDIGKCRHCGLVYVTNPIDESQLTKLYTEEYYLELEGAEYSPGSANLNLRRLFWFNRQRLNSIEGIKKPGRLLDVGCGPGFFLASAQKRGWEVAGLDISTKAEAFARRRFGLDIAVCQPEQAEFPRESFDLITMWHVLEHMPHPLVTLRKAYELLKPDGLLLVQVPNVNSLPARMKRARFSEFSGPKFHRYYFSLTSLTELLRVAGFRNLSRLDCRYREAYDFKSGIKKMIKAPFFALNLDSFLAIVAGKARRRERN